MVYFGKYPGNNIEGSIPVPRYKSSNNEEESH